MMSSSPFAPSSAQASPFAAPTGNIGDAFSLGLLSQASAGLLSIPNIGNQINAAMGAPSLSVNSSEVLIVSLLMDDSSSIRFAQGNTQLMRDGHNLVLDSLAGSKQAVAIQISCRYLNGGLLYDYRPLAGAIKMDGTNYNPAGGTPLYDQSIVLLGTVAAKVAQFMGDGIPARSITLIGTDGHDEGSTHSAADVALVAKDLLGQSEQHIIAGMGIADGSTDFNKVFGDMGLLKEWILTPGNSAGEIRKCFQLFSQSAVRASQSAQSFSQTAAGGFAQP